MLDMDGYAEIIVSFAYLSSPNSKCIKAHSNACSLG